MEAGLTGDPKTIAEHVQYFFPTGRAEFDASPNGVVLYSTRDGAGRLLVADRKGAELRVMSADGLEPYHLDIAADGKRAAVTMVVTTTRVMDIWIYDLVRGVGDRATSDPGVETTPAWSPDGRTLIYSRALGGVPRLVQRTLASGASVPIGGVGAFQTMGSFTRDGRSIYYQARERGSTGIARTMLGVPKATEVVADDPSYRELDPQVSPDGQRLAFVADASGTFEIYVQDLVSGDRTRISNRGGTLPRWRGDGAELFYVAPDQTIVSATPRGEGWRDVELTELFRARNTISGFDPFPDGHAFLLGEVITSPTDSLIHVATGW